MRRRAKRVAKPKVGARLCGDCREPCMACTRAALVLLGRDMRALIGSAAHSIDAFALAEQVLGEEVSWMRGAEWARPVARLLDWRGWPGSSHARPFIQVIARRGVDDVRGTHWGETLRREVAREVGRYILRKASIELPHGLDEMEAAQLVADAIMTPERRVA